MDYRRRSLPSIPGRYDIISFSFINIHTKRREASRALLRLLQPLHLRGAPEELTTVAPCPRQPSGKVWSP